MFWRQLAKAELHMEDYLQFIKACWSIQYNYVTQPCSVTQPIVIPLQQFVLRPVLHAQYEGS
jgi:hypothetical protein